MFIKFINEKGHKRQVKKDPKTYEEMLKLAGEVFKTDMTNFTIGYIDSDGELITMINNEDWKVCMDEIKEINAGKKITKMTIKLIRKDDGIRESITISAPKVADLPKSVQQEKANHLASSEKDDEILSEWKFVKRSRIKSVPLGSPETEKEVKEVKKVKKAVEAEEPEEELNYNDVEVLPTNFYNEILQNLMGEQDDLKEINEEVIEEEKVKEDKKEPILQVKIEGPKVSPKEEEELKVEFIPTSQPKVEQVAPSSFYQKILNNLLPEKLLENIKSDDSNNQKAMSTNLLPCSLLEQPQKTQESKPKESDSCLLEIKYQPLALNQPNKDQSEALNEENQAAEQQNLLDQLPNPIEDEEPTLQDQDSETIDLLHGQESMVKPVDLSDPQVFKEEAEISVVIKAYPKTAEEQELSIKDEGLNVEYGQILTDSILGQCNKSLISQSEKHEPEQGLTKKMVQEVECLIESKFRILSQSLLNKPEVKEPIKKNDSNQTTHNVYCNNCSVYPIVGVRYHSLIRRDFDLCEKCEELLDLDEPMIKFKKEETNPERFGQSKAWKAANEHLTANLAEPIKKFIEKKPVVKKRGLLIRKAPRRRVANMFENKDTVAKNEPKMEKRVSKRLDKVKQLKDLFPSVKITKILRIVDANKNMDINALADKLIDSHF